MRGLIDAASFSLGFQHVTHKDWLWGTMRLPQPGARFK